jgi:3-dehydroquinate synthetase
MSLFLPSNVSPLPPAADMQSWKDESIAGLENAEFFKLPKGLENRSVKLDYTQLNASETLSAPSFVQKILDTTPKPKGRNAFTSVHVVAPPESTKSAVAEKTIATLQQGCDVLKKEIHLHRLNPKGCKPDATPMEEYETIFEAASSLLMEKADRASILVFVGWENTSMDAYAAFIAMLPFRGVQCALISRRESYRNILNFTTPSGTFVFDALTAARMGKFSVHSVFGHLPSRTFNESVNEWRPVDISECEEDESVVKIPFKIGGLSLPMLTHNGTCDDALYCLSELLNDRFPNGYTPIVSCGETCDALGYGQDMLDALDQDDGLLFSHKSGETYKRYDNYGTDRLFATINKARESGAPPVIIAVGGGVNGNCIGLIAGMTNCEFIEVPTTPMHYNDAVTSAKKAFSLVVDDRILSKNILGCFYLPQLAFCVNEWLLTISSANAHATVGEATKTMNMLGMANSVVGATDFHNITGAVEFASDFTKILSEVEGFDNLINFIEDKTVARKKRAIINVGKKIAALREAKYQSQKAEVQQVDQVMHRRFPSRTKLMSMSSMASLFTAATIESSSDKDYSSFSESPSAGASSTSISGYGSEMSLSDDEENESELELLIVKRREMMKSFRLHFTKMNQKKKESILSFLTTINREIVCAKAMFLAYSDPFEKYRALLFEYAHTLGHGVEAFANDLYLKARNSGVEVSEDALRLHGQCVGMAVLWAGQMSKDLGKLEGEGFQLHQSFPYLFNRAGGFSFGPLRNLCDELNVEKDEFCEKVLQVVRRDNKRGYCNCSDPQKSVDQLVTCRPGKMLRSEDPNAEIRYLVEVDEEWQKNVLELAFDGYFDKVADLQDGKLRFRSSAPITKNRDLLRSTSSEVAAYIRTRLLKAYTADVSN